MVAGMALAARPAAAAPVPLGGGWYAAEYAGIGAAQFALRGEWGVSVHAPAGHGGFVYRRLAGAATCLSWRWRVEAGPPGTDLTRRGGDDRALSIAVGFAGWPPGVSLWQRTQYSVAQAQTPSHTLPRAMLLFVWGGTGREPPRFPSPWMAGLGQVRILRTAGAPRGAWFEESVDLPAEWAAAFGGTPPPLQEIAIGCDADDTRTRVEAMVERIAFGPCR